MSKPFAAFAVILASCVPSAEARSSDDSTPYSCAGIVPGHQIARVDPAIVKPWRELAEAPATDTFWLARVQVQTNRKLPTALTTEERVRLQYQLLRVAQKLDGLRRTSTWAGFANAHESVMALVKATAPTSFELDILGDGAHPQVTAILGTEITERATRTCGNGNSIHARKFGGALAFRPLRAGQTRALVSQIVAFDTDGKPHVTPLVEGMELRLGSEISSPACVVEAGDDGVLRTAKHDEIHEHAPFVKKKGEGVGCNNCHYSDNTMQARDLDAFETFEVDAARNAQVESLANRRWQLLNAPL